MATTLQPSRLHGLALAGWAVAAAASVQLAPSPVYVAVVMVIAAVVVETHRRPGPLANAFRLLLAVGVLFAVVRLVLTALTTHGSEHTLVTLPALTLPKILGGFTVGGAVESGVVLHAAAEGFAIVGILAVFGAFNAAVAHDELVNALPRAFYEMGLIVTIALAFVPSTVAAVASVREADRARTGGRPVRRGRLVRQVVPVLETGLERALALAESMDARGFGHHPPTGAEATSGWMTLVSLLALGGAFVALVGGAPGPALAFGLAGGAGLIVATAVASRASRRTRYRPRAMTRADWMVLVVSAAAPLALAALAFTGDHSLAWSGLTLRWPPFNAVAVLALAPLTVPVAVRW